VKKFDRAQRRAWINQHVRLYVHRRAQYEVEEDRVDQAIWEWRYPDAVRHRYRGLNALDYTEEVRRLYKWLAAGWLCSFSMWREGETHNKDRHDDYYYSDRKGQEIKERARTDCELREVLGVHRGINKDYGKKQNIQPADGEGDDGVHR
jgi:hypothetical protein